MSMKIKKDDQVVVLAGACKGQVGKVLRVLTKLSKVVVEGVNVVNRHVKPRSGGESGSIEAKTLPVHSSNVSLYNIDGDNKVVASRVGCDFQNGKKYRVYRKTGEHVKGVS